MSCTIDTIHFNPSYRKPVLDQINKISNILFSREHCTVPSLDETMEFAVKNDVILLLDVKYNSKRVRLCNQSTKKIMLEVCRLKHFHILSILH